MKKILQVKKQRKVTAPSASLTNASAKRTRCEQKTLHPLFTWGAAQKVAANQSRLQALLEQPPSTTRLESVVRKRRKIQTASSVPRLFLLSSGELDDSYVVPGFEEYLSPAVQSNLPTKICKKQRGVTENDSKTDIDLNVSKAKRRSRESFSPTSHSVKPLEEKHSRTAVVSPANTVTTNSDQRIPERELSALREIITNHQVPSIIPCLTEKSPSCTPTHSVQPAITQVGLDKRVSDWVDNCVSQELNRHKLNDVAEPIPLQFATKKDAYEENLICELQKSYLRLVDTEECSDLVIETADRAIRAHKAILFLRCPKVYQVLSSDSSFWNMRWCSSKAAIFFLQYLYAADVSFVPHLSGKVRKDLLTLCCQYQTDELAARLIRERSPSPPPFSQLHDLTKLRAKKRSPALCSPSSSSAISGVGAKPFEINGTNAQTYSRPEQKSVTSPSSSTKKTRMSITCETVSVTVPEDSRHSIHLSPRLPQTFSNFPQMCPRLDSEPRKDNSTKGSPNEPIEVSSNSDLFSDTEDIIVRPLPPLSPLQMSPLHRQSPERLLSRRSFSQPIINLDMETPPRKKSNVIESLDVTPLPRYSLMKTPEMHKHLDRYGIKNGIGKKKAVQLLKHIYNSKHPSKDDDEAEKSEGSSSEQDDDALPLEETMAQGDDHDHDMSENVEEKITRYIKNTPTLYDRILRFEPLEVMDFKKELTANGIRVNDKVLLNYLDYQCVNISFGTQRKAMRSPKKQRRRKIAVRKPITASQP